MKWKSELNYVPNYTFGIYLSGVIYLILQIFGLVLVVFFIPLEIFETEYGNLIVGAFFGGILGIIMSLLFLFVKRKVIYLSFIAFLFLGLVTKAFTYSWLYAETGRISGIGMGIGLPFIIMIYLISQYKMAFIPKEKVDNIFRAIRETARKMGK